MFLIKAAVTVFVFYLFNLFHVVLFDIFSLDAKFITTIIRLIIFHIIYVVLLSTRT